MTVIQQSVVTMINEVQVHIKNFALTEDYLFVIISQFRLLWDFEALLDRLSGGKVLMESLWFGNAIIMYF